MEPESWPPPGGRDGDTWKDNDGSFVNRGGTWYRDSGKIVGFFCGDDCRYSSVGDTSPTPGYDGKVIIPSSNYDYSYDLMPGKQADDTNYVKNGEGGTMVSRLAEIVLRDATEPGNRDNVIEAVVPIITATKGRGSNKLSPNKSATGNHTTFQRGNNGKIYKYETYQKTKSGHFNPTKRYDGGKPDGTPGRPHRNKTTGESVPTPHVQGKSIKGGVRPAQPREIPKQ